MALSLKMADNKESHVLRDEVKSNSLLNAILPIDVILETQNTMMATHFSKSPYWQSLLIIGQSQVQRNGLLFQAALTHASLDKQIMYVMTKEFTRIPPTTHSLPNVETGNMANITFKYCQEMKSLEELLIGFCTIPNELLPDVLVVNGLNEYKRGKGPLSQFHYSSILSLLSETAEYIGRRKKTTIMLYVSLSLLLAVTVEEQKPWIELFKQWAHEVWILEGNSNRLVSAFKSQVPRRKRNLECFQPAQETSKEMIRDSPQQIQLWHQPRHQRDNDGRSKFEISKQLRTSPREEVRLQNSGTAQHFSTAKRGHPEGGNDKRTFNKSNHSTSYNIQEVMTTIKHSGETDRDGPTPNKKRGHKIEVNFVERNRLATIKLPIQRKEIKLRRKKMSSCRSRHSRNSCCGRHTANASHLNGESPRMPEVPNAADFRNSSLATSTKLQSCSDLEKAQHGLYQAAHLFYAASLLIPHHTFVWSIFISRILMGLAYALVTVWACLELCAPDVFAWNVLLTAGTLVHIVYWSWRFRPGRIRQKPLLELYQKLFLPLDCSRELFVQLTNKSVIRSLQVGDDFFLATRQLCSIPASSNPSASMRLSVLLTGKMRVTFGLGQRLLHHIEPFQFVDSPEWYMMQNVSPQDVKASKIQVSITADEPCTLLQLDAENLNHLTVNNPPLRFLLDCLIGKDVSQKLYAVTEQAALMVTSRDPSSKQDRLPSLQVGGGGSSVGVNSTTTYSSLGPWQGELLRSQSADAVHTCKQGQVRSINWRRDQTRRIWARRYQKLVPTRHHRPLKKPAPCRQEMSRRGDHLGKEDPGDCGGGKVSSSPKYPTLEVGNRHEQIIRIEPHHQERLHWNRVQFDETFV